MSSTGEESAWLMEEVTSAWLMEEVTDLQYTSTIYF